MSPRNTSPMGFRHLWLSLSIVFASTNLFAGPWPTHFWWGIASSAYQTEDQTSTFTTDWDLYYREGKLKYPKKEGTFSYSETARDIEALKFLGVTHYRFSIEWARVEPKPGEFDQTALDHYSQFVSDLKAAGIEPVVCFWHFTFPDWGSDLKDSWNHGWNNPLIQNHWPLYVQTVLKALNGKVKIFAPMNEVAAQAAGSYLLGNFPPGSKLHFKLYRSQIESASKAYIQASHLIHSQSPDSKVITVQNMIWWKKSILDPDSEINKLGQDYNFGFLDLVVKYSDYIGFNYYFASKASPTPWGKRKIYPEGMRLLIEQLTARYHKPLVITENGVGTDDDRMRETFLENHVSVLEQALADGYDVRGYMFWTLIDNFEWNKGYTSKFGLFSIDNESRKIIAKPSALIYKNIINEAQHVLLLNFSGNFEDHRRDPFDSEDWE